MTRSPRQRAADGSGQHLSRRERQIMDALWAAGELSAADVRAAIPDPPSYSAVRALLRKLLDKGVVHYREDGPRYLYAPVVAREEARHGAVRRLVDTFFGGSASAAVAGLLGSGDVSAEELAELEALLAAQRRRRSRR